MPAKAATVSVLRYTYPPRCQSPEGGVPLVVHATKREEEAQNTKGDAPLAARSIRREEGPHFQPKMILRPKVTAVATSRVGGTQNISTFLTCCVLPDMQISPCNMG